MDKTFDLVIIGAGSAGFSAAIKGAELGKKVALIENSTIGGTCVNVGCVPSKLIISKAFSGNNWNSIKRERDKLVTSLRNKKYIDVLEKYSKNVTYIHESASFKDKNSICLSRGKIITASKYIITTGSTPSFPNLPGMSKVEPLDSKDLIFSKALPKSIIIVGGRFIALELGQAFAKLGVKVTILQRSNHLIPQYDPLISRRIKKVFSEQGIDIITGTKLISANITGNVKTIRFSFENKKEELNAEKIVFATGRKGNTESLNLIAAGIKTDSDGHIITDKYLQTSNPLVFAAGDVIASPGLVYVAAKEGQTAVQNAYSNEPDALEYNNVPEVIFTHPQISRVGISEKEAADNNFSILTSIFKISDTPYGLVNNDQEGIIKLIKNTKNSQLLGAEIIAADAGNMIQTITIAIKAKMTSNDLVDTYFPYLTAVEGIKLSAIKFDKDVKKLSCCAS